MPLRDDLPMLDYKGPDRANIEPMHAGLKGGLIGAGSLGCLVPLILAIICGLVLNDMGGPLFFPILIVFGILVGFPTGAAVGWMVRIARRR